jgi:hypothetical protein
MNEELERQDRGRWYLLTGFVIGAVIGLAYTWAVSPLRYVDTPPAALRENFKDDYRALIAAAFAANGDLARANARLALLEEQDAYRAVASQAQQTLAQGGSSGDARALGLLAAALRQAAESGSGSEASATAAPQGPTPAVGTELPPTAIASSITVTPTLSAGSTLTPTTRPTRTSTPTRTPLPSRTPTATPGAPFELADQEAVCDPDLGQPLLQVLVLDAAGQPVPGVAVIVRWSSGEERFFTGFKPELGVGYADFTMVPGVGYSLALVDGGGEVQDLSAQECAGPRGSRYWGGWSLTFIQPEA